MATVEKAQGMLDKYFDGLATVDELGSILPELDKAIRNREVKHPKMQRLQQMRDCIETLIFF